MGVVCACGCAGVSVWPRVGGDRDVCASALSPWAGGRVVVAGGGKMSDGSVLYDQTEAGV